MNNYRYVPGVAERDDRRLHGSEITAVVSSCAMTEAAPEADTRPRLILRVVPSQGPSFDHVLESDSLVIGRSSTSDLTLSDRFLSRRHTQIHRAEDGSSGWLVTDLGSHNGTLLNGRRLDAPRRLRLGDHLVLSSTTIRVQSLDGRAAPDVREQVGVSTDSGVRKVLRDATVMLSREALEAASRSSDRESLRKVADRLRLLNEIHDALGRSVALEELFELILDRVFATLRPEQAWILVKEGADSPAAPVGGSGLRAVAARSVNGDQPDPPHSRNLADEVMGRRMAALVVNAETDERFAAAQSLLLSGIKSLLAVPLLAGDESGASTEAPDDVVLGMIVLSSRAHVKLFEEEDLELLVSLASVAALRIRNVALAEEAAERRRLEKELALARRIQERLLPDSLPELEGWSLHAHNVPSRGVSGDYYTLAVLRDGGRDRLWAMIADVSGKGMGASLLTASLEALCAGPLEEGMPPEDVCERVSRHLFERTPPEKYATALLADLDPVAGTLQFCNAGHNPGLLVRQNGEIEHLTTSGPPLGLLPGMAFARREVEVEPGDWVVLYTDGITEASDPDDQEFGIERLEAVCSEHRGEDPDRLADVVGRHLDQFAQGVPYADDRTLVILKRRG
ncbi:MAG: SpoIIE family protein phosphatase [Thermoanaerobaculia bacterium]|nr:SpoIIE family protein phosphatase [Thermoanaerobaculia bacterium]